MASRPALVLLGLLGCRGCQGCRACHGGPDPETAEAETGPDTACEARSWYADRDEDGYGDPGALQLACEPPSGTVADASDCDDADPEVHPGVESVCADTRDNDCDALPDCPEARGEGLLADASATFTAGYDSFLGDDVIAADYDGDGRRDLLLGARFNSTAPDSGAIYLVLGPTRGAYSLPEQAEAVLTTDAWPGEGWKLAGGDLNGDGWPDAVAGVNETEWVAIRYYVAYGPLSGAVDLEDDAVALLRAEGTEYGIEPYAAVADLLHDDGQDDLLLNPDGWPERAGNVFVLAGPVTASGDFTTEADAVLEDADEADEGIPNASLVGDLDGDGQRDLGLSYDGVCVIFEVQIGYTRLEDACEVHIGPEDDTRLGPQTADGGDVDGDGYAELLASSVSLDHYHGASVGDVGLYSGYLLSHPDGVRYLDDEDNATAWFSNDDCLDCALGNGLASPGDLDGDGYAEVFLSDPDYEHVEDELVGGAWLWYGPVEGTHTPQDADWSLIGEEEESNLGFRAFATPREGQDNALLFVNVWPYDGVTVLYQFTPEGY